MADVKWIKITTNMFDDEKIKLIESLPEKDSILIIWIKLLTQAGKTNASGYIYLNESIPYTDEMLATIFNRPLNTVRLALKTFKQFGMIEIDDTGIYIANWDKHQSIDKLDKIREQNRLRKQKQRDLQKQLMAPVKEEIGASEYSHVTVTGHHAIELEQELDKELDIDKNKELLQEDSGSKDFKDVVSAYQNGGYGTINFTSKNMLVDLTEEYGPEWVIEAIKIAVKQNKRKLSYVEGILQNWRRDGGMKLEGGGTNAKDRDDPYAGKNFGF